MLPKMYTKLGEKLAEKLAESSNGAKSDDAAPRTKAQGRRLGSVEVGNI